MYTRSKLTAHRRDGDSDDRSHRGHPWCEFCDERYLDNDALHSHLRKVHFWCHFCEVDGRQDYFPSVHALRAHFKSDHFLCEEGNCRNDILTSTFRNEIDLKAHKASTHSKGMSKADVKKMRCLPVDFAYSNSTSSSATGEYREGGAAAAARRRGNHLITNTGASSKKLMMVTRDTKSAQMRYLFESRVQSYGDLDTHSDLYFMVELLTWTLKNQVISKPFTVGVVYGCGVQSRSEMCVIHVHQQQ